GVSGRQRLFRGGPDGLSGRGWSRLSDQGEAQRIGATVGPTTRDADPPSAGLGAVRVCVSGQRLEAPPALGRRTLPQGTGGGSSARRTPPIGA
ncbi:MAG: hypothetical protein, partial [Olavius algarvensis Gamma 1 endosymbiont]